MVALLAPVLIGCGGLATEGGLWIYEHQTLQGAADSAALSAATLYSLNTSKSLTTQASGIVATYGYTVGVNSTTVTVHRPPTTGNYTSNSKAVEIIVSTSQPRLLSGIYSSTPVTITGLAVALAGNNGTGCVLSLNSTVSGGTTSQGSSAIVLNGCSLYDNSSSGTALINGGSATITADSVNVVGGISGTGITATNGINKGVSAISDPYASVSPPSFSGCDSTNLSIKTTVTLNPGVYCQGIQMNAGANVTLNPGIYYIDRGSLSVNGSATLSGTGVTLVFTSSTGSNYASALINGGATINLTAPTTGPTAGIVIYGDRKMPTSTTFKFNGGSGQILGGAVYLPDGTVNYSGGASGSTNCTQLIGDTITFSGNANLAVNCSSYGTQSIGISQASLVE
ncbi:MAG: hypothetical protein HY243_15260 [Proteobacteria bacterium]|nr:hypothetical protein [Pseudomonadota bacterium]